MVHNTLGAVGRESFEPFLKERRDFERQAQDCIGRIARAQLCRSGHDALELTIIQARYHRAQHYACADAGVGKFLQSLKSLLRRWAARFHRAGEASVLGRNGYHATRLVFLCHGREDIDITHNQIGFRQQRNRMIKFGQNA